MLKDLDTAIKYLLENSLKDNGFVDPITVSFAIPNSEWSSKVDSKFTINCYLFDIHERRLLREEGRRLTEEGRKLAEEGRKLAEERRRLLGEGRRVTGEDRRFAEDNRNPRPPMYEQPPLYFEMTYLITAWCEQIEDEHRLLWHVLEALMDHPILPAPPERTEPLADEWPVVHTAVAQLEGVLKSPGEFWTALGNQIKPSLTYTVLLGRQRKAPASAAQVKKVELTATVLALPPNLHPSDAGNGA